MPQYDGAMQAATLAMFELSAPEPPESEGWTRKAALVAHSTFRRCGDEDLVLGMPIGDMRLKDLYRRKGRPCWNPATRKLLTRVQYLAAVSCDLCTGVDSSTGLPVDCLKRLSGMLLRAKADGEKDVNSRMSAPRLHRVQGEDLPQTAGTGSRMHPVWRLAVFGVAKGGRGSCPANDPRDSQLHGRRGSGQRGS